MWGENVCASVLGLRGAAGPATATVVCNNRGAAQPSVGDMVTCRVTRIQSRLASVEIICVGNGVLRNAASGLIRREDILPRVEGLETQVYRAFRPGDVVLARVISLGDSRSYFLSTAAPELGVVIARSAEGHRMTPLSWREMECPVSKAREPRKCAKPPEKGPPAADGGDAAG